MTNGKAALVVGVTPTLLDWVRAQGIRRPYFPEEDCVWLIPSSCDYSTYLEEMRDLILDAELQRFGSDLRHRVLRDHPFEDLIQISIRENVVCGPGAC